MTHHIQSRLTELKTEFEKGQARTLQLEGELRSLHETMLRISGAIQVLEELQSSAAADDARDKPVLVSANS